jgi:SAM-dependent methyltransferase
MFFYGLCRWLTESLSKQAGTVNTRNAYCEQVLTGLLDIYTFAGEILVYKNMKKDILDMCCGTKSFWFNKEHPDVLFIDRRREKHTLSDGREIEINPDKIEDFRKLSFKDNTFRLVIFDPPHLKSPGKNSWILKKYGKLDPKTWREDIRQGFKEAFRVLEPGGFLVFKWNETEIKLSEILSLTEVSPLLGHRSGKTQRTHWILFKKPSKKSKP